MLPPKIWIICRVCLEQRDKLYNIFENRFLTNIWYILRDCGGVPVRIFHTRVACAFKVCK